MERQQDYVLRTVEERGIRLVWLWFTDVLGQLKSFATSPAELEAAFVKYAKSQAKAHGVDVNLTSAARDLLRRALGMTPAHSCNKEGFYRGVAEAKRTQRPILLVSAAPHCHNISGIW